MSVHPRPKTYDSLGMVVSPGGWLEPHGGGWELRKLVEATREAEEGAVSWVKRFRFCGWDSY